MVVDRAGHTAAVGEVYLVAGKVRRIEGSTDLLIVIGKNLAVRVAAADVARVDDALAGGGGGGGGATWISAEVDLGTAPSTGGSFDVSGSFTSGNVALIVDAPGSVSIGDADDRLEMDAPRFAGSAISSSVLRVYWHSATPVAGKRRIAFTTFAT